MYYIKDEASEAIEGIYDNLEDAIEDAKNMNGKKLVIDEHDNVLYDTKPGISYKF